MATKIEKYKCDFCGEEFSSSDDCLKHEKESHPAAVDWEKVKTLLQSLSLDQIVSMICSNTECDKCPFNAWENCYHNQSCYTSLANYIKRGK